MTMKKSLSALAIAAALLCGSCLGPNKTFNDLHAWNKTATENKWGNEAIFLGLNIIPVYGLCYLADVIVFNSIEFWKGEGK
jgi:hypothetical protein